MQARETGVSVCIKLTRDFKRGAFARSSGLRSFTDVDLGLTPQKALCCHPHRGLGISSTGFLLPYRLD